MKKQRNQFVVGLIFLLVLIAVIILAVVGNINKNLKKEIVTPLPESNPQFLVEEILGQKNIKFEGNAIASDSAILVKLSPPLYTEVWFDARLDLSVQVSSLQIILNKLTIEGRKAQKVDLRFSDPLVVY
ncbi:hypothetical protein HYT17_01810 [Candidatus Microgenomates bacterium]|nr:hypothetical protein [Candidatus Microgenomates bacterium]